MQIQNECMHCKWSSLLKIFDFEIESLNLNLLGQPSQIDRKSDYFTN
jgi:hypothetical protein